jgi:hypothetical protein
MREAFQKLETPVSAEAAADKPSPLEKKGLDKPASPEKQEPVKPEKEAGSHEVEQFLDKEAEILAAYGLRGDITLERSDKGWAFDFENKRLMYDPNFFIERGYSLKETLFATTHELMAHYGELMRDPEFVLREARRYSQSKPHLHILYNIFEDVLGNRRIVSELPFLDETRTTLYREKMFPQTDYTDQSSHVQFVYGFIRESMVSGEPVKLGPEARQALEELRAFGKDKTDVLDLVTTPTIDPRDRFRIMRSVIEPIYEKLYRSDLEKERQKQGEGEGKEGEPKDQEGPPQGQRESEGKSGEKKESEKKGKKRRWPWQKKEEEQKGGGEPKKEQKGGGRSAERKAMEEAVKKFKKEYEAYENTHPEPLSPKDEEKIKEVLKEIAEKKGGLPSLDRSILEQWAKEHGVSPEDVIGYRNEFHEIEPLIKELREVFKKIVSKRLRERMRLSPQLQKEGEELEEGTLAEVYAESRAGGEPRAFREMERRKREEMGYGVLDMTLVNDLSGSMEEGGKLEMDRKSKTLFLESLADFQKEIQEAEFESGMSLGLEVRTETRAFGDFGDAELKALSPALTEKDRIGIWKKLHRADGGTPDYLSLEAVLKEITPEYEKELKDKTRRRVVVVLSDGASQDQERYMKSFKELEKRGIIMVDLGMLTSARPGAEVIEDIKKLPQAVQKVILKYIQDL